MILAQPVKTVWPCSRRECAEDDSPTAVPRQNRISCYRPIYNYLLLGSFCLAATLSVTAEPVRKITTETVPQVAGEALLKGPEIYGKPRKSQGHPCTLWDREDIEQYQESLKVESEAKVYFETFKKWGEQRIQQPLGVPTHLQAADGGWDFPGYKRGSKDSQGRWIWEWKFNGILQTRAKDIINLGFLYALSGDEKFAAFAKRILLELGDAYGGRQAGTSPNASGQDHFEPYGFDGADSGLFLAKAAVGYDLIYNLSSITKLERERIEDQLILPMAEHLKGAILKHPPTYRSRSKWGPIELYGVFISGMALHEPGLSQSALCGQGGTRHAPEEGGLLDCFNPTCVSGDGHWGKSLALEDQLSAMDVMVQVAEVMWHHEMDLYGYQNGVLKRLFCFPIHVSPSSTTVSSLSDSEYTKLAKMPGINVYEYAFRRYREERYLPIIKRMAKPIGIESQSLLPPLVFADRK